MRLQDHALQYRALRGKNDLSYEHQTRHTHTLWESLGMRRPGGRKAKGQGRVITKTVTVAQQLLVAAVAVVLYQAWC